MIKRKALTSFGDYYRIGEEIGSGKFAIVKRCICNETQNEFAAKFIRKSRFGRMGQKSEDIELEIEILLDLNHDNIIKLIDIFEDNYQVILVFELMKGGELQDYIIENKYLNEMETKYLLKQILIAIDYLHNKSIVHLDLKPENILLNDNNNGDNCCCLKIIDFGISRRYDYKSDIKGIYGTPEFIAPEILNYEPIGFGTDLWAIGCITYNMLFGVSPFFEEKKQDTYTKITKLDYNFNNNNNDCNSDVNITISDDAKDFIRNLLVKDIRKRMTAKQCLEHCWLSSIKCLNEMKILKQSINGNGKIFYNHNIQQRWKKSIYLIIMYNRHLKRRNYLLSAIKQNERKKFLINRRSYHYLMNQQQNSLNNNDKIKINGSVSGSVAISSYNSSIITSSSTISTKLSLTMFEDNKILSSKSTDGVVNNNNNNNDNDENFILAALFGAIEEGNLHSIKELFHASNIDPNQCNKHGESLLHYCAGLGQLEIFKFLCSIGADINVVDDQEDTVLHWSARQNHPHIIRYVYEQTASIELINKNNETPLHVAARYGHVETVEQLCKCGANINAVDEHGETAILIAVWHGFPKIVHILGEIGADTNIMNKEEESALHVASARGHYECVRCLLDAGANANLRNKNSFTPLHLALKRQHQIIAMLLLKYGADYELPDDNGERAIHYSARYNLLSIGQWLCQNNRCQVNMPNKHGLYPLHIAAKSGHIEIVRTLCLAGSVVDQKDKDSIIPQICAIAQSHNDVADLLTRLRNEQKKDEFIQQLIPNNFNNQTLLPRIKLKIFGHSGAGKSTLIESLKCGYFSSWFRRSKGLNNNFNNNNNNNNVNNTTTNNKLLIEQKQFNKQSMNNLSIISNGSVNNNNNNNVPIMNGKKLINDTAINQQQQQIRTKGIDCQQLYISGVGDLSVWEFSGHSCYQQIYDHFLGDIHCIHAIVFRLCDTFDVQINNIFYWLYFIQSRIPIVEPLLNCGKSQNCAKIILIATHADLAQKTLTLDEIDKNLKNISQKVMEKFKYIFDIYDNIFMMDANVAGSLGMKQLKQYLNNMKINIVQDLPHTTGFLDSVLTFLNLYRKVSPNFPVLNYNQFKDMIRSQINPLSSDDHFKELVQQLEKMGEIIFLKSTNITNFDLLILNPKWLNCDIIGKLLSMKNDTNYLYNLNKTKIMGIYTIDEFQELFDDIDALDLLQLLELLSICTPIDNNNGDDIEYEFSCFIFAGDWDELLDRFQFNDNHVYHGFIWHLEQSLSSQTFGTILTSLFPRIQTTLRNELRKHSTYSSYELNNCFKFSYLTNNNNNGDNDDIMFIISLNTIIQSIEIRFSGLYEKRRDCFFFMQEIIQIIEKIINDCAPGLSLSKTYMSPLQMKDKRENLSYYSSRTIMKSLINSNNSNSINNNNNHYNKMNLLNKKIKSDDNLIEEKIGDIICFGICDLNEINLPPNGEPTLANELHSSNLSIYTKQKLCQLLDPPETIGRDWCMFGILLGMTDKLPKLDPGINNVAIQHLSPTARLLEECVRNNNCTIKVLIEKLFELNRFDCIDCIYETGPLLRIYPLQSLPEEGIIYNDESLHTSLGVSTLSHTSSSNLSR